MQFVNYLRLFLHLGKLERCIYRRFHHNTRARDPFCVEPATTGPMARANFRTPNRSGRHAVFGPDLG